MNLALVPDPARRRRIQRFDVIEQIGGGGMGVVVRAYDPQLEREVAIKTAQVGAVGLAPDGDRDTVELAAGRGLETAGDQLLREARMMARLSHANVVPVYEAGLVDGALFVVMELVDGVDLARWLAVPRRTADVLAVFVQAGRGLAAAHAHGIVHRDFKPANVLIGRDGRVRVADFGLSIHAAPATMWMLDSGHGTPRYMAPELWRGARATIASDVYAFCSALDHALGGEPGADRADRDRRWRDRGLAPRLRAVLAAGLADDPADRPALETVISAAVPAARRLFARDRRRRRLGRMLAASA